MKIRDGSPPYCLMLPCTQLMTEAMFFAPVSQPVSGPESRLMLTPM